MFYYVYKFIDIDDKVVYVGKTNNLENRITHHASEFKELNAINKVVFAPLETKVDMDIYELYLISKIRPRLNRAGTGRMNLPSQLELPKLEFKEYKAWRNILEILEKEREKEAERKLYYEERRKNRENNSNNDNNGIDYDSIFDDLEW